jgi:DNA-binding IclR family transcriptional regulator
MTKPDYTHAGQQRLLQLLMRLFGHEMHGVTLTEVSQWMSIAPVALRDLHNLQEAGLAEQLADSRWRLTPKLPQRRWRCWRRWTEPSSA